MDKITAQTLRIAKVNPKDFDEELSGYLRAIENAYPIGIPPSTFAHYTRKVIESAMRFVPLVDVRMFLGNCLACLRELRSAPMGAFSEALADICYAIYDAKDAALERKMGISKHCERTSQYAEALAESLGMPSDDVTKVRLSAYFHDVGKLAVPDHVLLKPHRLEGLEWYYIIAHPGMGRDIFRSLTRVLPDVSDGIYSHHENWNGTGYPTRRRGEEIPLYGRILRIADAFDAMTSRRPFEKAKSLDEAMNEIMENPYGQFDPQMARKVACFKSAYANIGQSRNYENKK
ncbi:MAG: HD-GYP domain-containing protein [Candidatus Aenigmatarchaeota archaeon]